MQTTYYTVTLNKEYNGSVHTRRSNQNRKLSPVWIATLAVSLLIASIVFLVTYTIPQTDATNGVIIGAASKYEVQIPFAEGANTIHDQIENIKNIDPLPEVIETPEAVQTLDEMLGDSIINFEDSVLVMQPLPDAYYPGVNFSKFQPYMDWSKVTNPRSAAYVITRSENAYVDENGYRRYITTEDQFTIDGADDFVVALGTFYKPKGTCGQRFLVVTTGGMYTIICGDEKADIHTEEMNMFTWHGDSHEYAGMIEWIVDQKVLYKNDNLASRMGSIHYSSNPALAGDIIMMYRID